MTRQAASGAESVRHALHSVLGNHNLKEENIVYPGTDESMSPLERDALVARIQALWLGGRLALVKTLARSTSDEALATADDAGIVLPVGIDCGNDRVERVDHQIDCREVTR